MTNVVCPRESFSGLLFELIQKKKKIDNSLYILIDVQKRVNIKYYKGNGDKWDHWSCKIVHVLFFICKMSELE